MNLVLSVLVIEHMLQSAGPLAVIEGINTIAQQTTGVSLPKSPPPPAFPPLTNLDKAKFQNMFVEYGPENGLLSGSCSFIIFDSVPEQQDIRG